jgi:pilus assembly protein Flp/PilA
MVSRANSGDARKTSAPALEDVMLSRIAKLRRDDTGATAVEYGLMAALIAVVIIAGVTLLGTNLLAIFNQIAGVV